MFIVDYRQSSAEWVFNEWVWGASVYLRVCVCLFLFVVEIDTWKRVCLFVCLCTEAGDCFLSFLFVREIKGSVRGKIFFLKTHFLTRSRRAEVIYGGSVPLTDLKSYFCLHHVHGERHKHSAAHSKHPNQTSAFYESMF